MEETEVNLTDESSLEGSIQTRIEAVDTSDDLPGETPSSAVNGTDSPPHAQVTNEDTYGCLKMEKNLDPEDLLNNNKDAFQQEHLTDQKAPGSSVDDLAVETGNIPDQHDSSCTLREEDKIVIHQLTSDENTEQGEKEHLYMGLKEVDKEVGSTPSMESPKREPSKAPDFLEDLHNDVQFSNRKVTVIEDSVLHNELKFAKHKTSSSMPCLDLLVNGTSYQGEPTVRSFSPDLPTKVTSKRLQKNQHDDDFEKVKGRKWDEPLLGKRPVPIDDINLLSEELDPVAEEDFYDEEGSNDRDNLDHFMHYRSTDDRLDPRKERHQYVSDKLDPDVLQLLEMHLRKQQLVGIKEEGEEELLDLHINKEKPRTEPFKGLRNIAPVLDIVLEEPEQEHLGDTLEEDSKPPSEIDSDDSSNICAMEMGLMESLQNDLISKTSKIDKDEIVTILRKASPDLLLEHSSKAKDHAEHYKISRNSHREDIERKEKYTQTPELIVVSGRQENKLCRLYDRENISDPKSKQYVYKLDTSSEEHNYNAFKTPEQPVLHRDVNPNTEPIRTGDVSQTCKPVSSKKVDLSSYVPQRKPHCDDNNKHSASGTLVFGYEPHQSGFCPETKSCILESSTAEPQELGKAECAAGADVPTTFTRVNSKLQDDSSPNSMESIEKAPVLDNENEGSDSCPCQDSDFCSEKSPALLQTGIKESSEIEKTKFTDQHTLAKVKEKSDAETESSGQPAGKPDVGDTLHINLEEKILSLLEKAHAADCRSSHLQAEAEQLWKESAKLRNECKSLSNEAAELLSIVSQQRMVHRHKLEQSDDKTTQQGRDDQGTSNTKRRKKEALNFCGKPTAESMTTKILKGEDQVQTLCKKYSFLKQEVPEVIRELNSLQEDLKSLPQLQSKPVRLLYNMLWGGLITGGAMLLVWWSTRQLG